MASLRFPDTGTRVVIYRTGGVAADQVGDLFADEACTALAEVYADVAGVKGALITNAQILLDSNGEQPDYWGPAAGTDFLFLRVNGLVNRVDADYNSRIDGVEARVTSVESAGPTALAAHEADTTNIHGIANTAALVVTSDGRLSDARTPTSHALSHASAGSDPVTVAESQVTGLVGDLAAKAPLASPALSGIPTAPTATGGTNTTQVATTAFATAAAAAAQAASAQKSANLSDLASAATARTNIGVPPATRTISTTAPLSGGGDLSADRTITVGDAAAGAKGVIQLAGDLGGTAAAPTVPSLTGKAVKLTTTATKTTAYTAAANDLVPADATAGAFAVTLPGASAAGSGAQVVVKKIDATVNAVTVQRAGSDTINDAATSVTLSLSMEAFTFTSDGTSKWTLAAGQKSLSSLDGRYSKRGDFVYDVRDYGAVGNGTADDTAAIQAAIDAAIGGTPAAGATAARGAKHPVYLPKGFYKITAPLKIYSVIGFVLMGDGVESVIQVSGTGLPYALDINGSGYGQFRNFDVEGKTASDTVTTVIGLNRIPAVAQFTCTYNRFDEVSITNLKYVNGFGLGESSANLQVDNIELNHCSVNGKWVSGETAWWQAGFLSGSGSNGNVLNHTFVGCSAAYSRYNWWANACNITVLGGGCGYAEVDFRQSGARYVSVTGIRSETSQRLFEQQGGAGFTATAALRDVLWESNAIHSDKRWIRVQYPGSVILENIACGGTEAAPVIWVNLVSASVAAHITATGLITRNSVDAAFASAGTASPASLTIIGYTQVDAGGAPIARTPFLTRNLRAFAASERPTFSDGLLLGTATQMLAGSGSPEGVVTAPVSSVYTRTDGIAGTILYVKESGAGNTGWIAYTSGTPTPPDIQELTTAGAATWTKPPGAKTHYVHVVGGGGGSGGGRRGADGTVRCGGGGGGAGGVAVREFDAADLPSTVTVTVGAGGTAGASAVTDNTNGGDGGTGGRTTFGTYLAAFGGGGGLGGTATSGTGGTGVLGAAGTVGAGASASTSGGAGVGANPGIFSAGAGASGGGITALDVPGNGSSGGGTYYGVLTGGGTGGVVDSTAPTSGTASTAKGSAGPGGGSGAASRTAAAQGGATPAGAGGGAGGGGASLNGFPSGPGAAGPPGKALIITYFQ